MNDFKLKIEFFTAGESEINSKELDNYSNNLSGASFVDVDAQENKAFCELGVTDISFGVALINKNSYNGIVFDGKADENGACDVNFKLIGNNLNAIAIYFDDTLNEYATLIQVNEETYSNTRTTFVCVGLDNASEIDIKILKWNKPNAMVKVKSVSLDYTSTLDKKYIKSLERGSSLTYDNKKASFGITTQEGKIVMQDRDKYILDLAKNKVLKDGLTFELILNSRTIGKYISSNLKYSSTDDTLSIDLVDDIINLQDEIFIGVDFPTVPSDVVALSALEILTAFYPRKFNMDEETENHLSSIVFAYPKMPKKNAYKSLIDFCKATMTRVYKNEKGELWIKHFV